ncbi:flagellar biosynthesis anti-sigma factor FlgM [Candidatus Latescibacterota bacterium]
MRAGDVVEISETAQEAADLSAALKAAPEAANPRLAEVQARVKSGYYNTDEVRQQIADALLKSDGMREVVDDVAQTRVAKEKLDSVPDVREERVSEARQRVAEGHYDRADVRHETADKIVDELA